MKFCELQEEEFRAFSSEHALQSYLQTPEMAKSKQEDGWKTYFVGVKKNKKVLCAALLLEYPSKYFKSFYCPRGYLIDFRDKNLLLFFTDGLRKFVKNKKGVFLNIEPKVLYKQRDQFGKIVEDGFDNSDIYKNLIDLGYKHSGFYLKPDPSKQVRWAYIIDLQGKTSEQVFDGFKPNTRNIIRKAVKYGVTTWEIGYEELSFFKKLVDDSGELKNFSGRSLRYYQKMYNLYKPLEQIEFLVAELDIKKYISILTSERDDYCQKLDKLSEKSEAKRKEYNTQIANLTKRIKEANDNITQKGDKVILAGGMFLKNGVEMVYAFSGTSTEYRYFQAQYLIQWEMIRKSVEEGYKVYNFYGISGNFDPKDSRYGLYEFKKSFGGNVIEYLGDFDLIISPFKYYLRKILKKIRRG